MSQFRSLKTQFKHKHKNLANFHEHNNVAERIILHFMLITKNLNTTAQSCPKDTLHIIHIRETLRK